MSRNSTRRKIMKLGVFQDHLCFYCDEPFRYLDPAVNYDGDHSANDPDVASLDHVVAKSIGGSRALWNAVVAHRQCNSEKGSTLPDDILLFRLAALNAKRGFAMSDAPGTIVPDTFGPTTPAATYLCDLVNIVPGEEGVRLRRNVTRRLSIYGEYRTKLKPVVDRNFAHQVMSMLIARDQSFWKPLGEPYDNLINNILKTYVRREFYPKPEKLRPEPKIDTGT